MDERVRFGAHKHSPEAEVLAVQRPFRPPPPPHPTPPRTHRRPHLDDARQRRDVGDLLDGRQEAAVLFL